MTATDLTSLKLLNTMPMHDYHRNMVIGTETVSVNDNIYS